MNRPLISIIIPIYNVENFLPPCIDSVLLQTYENIEIILVDDGSSDNSRNICDAYSLKDNRIKVIHKENGGLSDARNVGIENINGDFVFFLDSDDLIEKDTIEYLYHMLTINNADMSICQRALIDEEGKQIVEKTAYFDSVIIGKEECLKALMQHKINDSACMKLYKSEIFHNIRFPKGKFNEDLFVSHLTIAQTQTIAVGKEQKYLYRIRKNSITHRNFEKRHLDVIEGAKRRLNFISLNYPSLIKYARAGMISAANLCSYTIINSSQHLKQLKSEIKLLQKYYRKYLKDFIFLKGSGFSAKVFASISFFCLRFAIRIARVFSREKEK